MPEKRFANLRKFNRAILNPIAKSTLAGRFSSCAIVYHLGRRSGKEYSTPVMAVIRGRHIFIPLTYGPDTDWYLNTQAAGGCRVKIVSRVYSAGEPLLVDAKTAAEAFPENVLSRVKLDHFLRLTIISESRENS